MFGAEFWQKFLNTDVLLEYGVISDNDLDNLFYTDDVNEAFTHITSSLKKNKDS